MKNAHCLNEQDMVLHYYNELPDSGVLAQHLADCPACAQRYALLYRDLSHLPDITFEADQAAGTRMVARVKERLHGQRKPWLPALGASAVAAIVVVSAIFLWPPQNSLVQAPHIATSSVAAMNLEEDMPDIDFLEDLEVLRELEFLRQIEGV
jgi:hypothetical protein